MVGRACQKMAANRIRHILALFVEILVRRLVLTRTRIMSTMSVILLQ